MSNGLCPPFSVATILSGLYLLVWYSTVIKLPKDSPQRKDINYHISVILWLALEYFLCYKGYITLAWILLTPAIILALEYAFILFVIVASSGPGSSGM
jgi:hypothetical protein